MNINPVTICLVILAVLAALSGVAAWLHARRPAPTFGVFCAVSDDDTNRVMTSPDGINWTTRAAAGDTNWTTRAAAGGNSWESVTWVPLDCDSSNYTLATDGLVVRATHNQTGEVTTYQLTEAGK